MQRDYELVIETLERFARWRRIRGKLERNIINVYIITGSIERKRNRARLTRHENGI